MFRAPDGPWWWHFGMMCGSHCFPDTRAPGCRRLDLPQLEAMGAGGDFTCTDVFSSQPPEVFLDFGGSDPAEGRVVAACGNGAPPHQCGSPQAVLPVQPGLHQPHNGQWPLGIFHGLHAPCQQGPEAATLTSPSPWHGLVAGTPSDALLLLV